MLQEGARQRRNVSSRRKICGHEWLEIKDLLLRQVSLQWVNPEDFRLPFGWGVLDWPYPLSVDILYC